MAPTVLLLIVVFIGSASAYAVHALNSSNNVPAIKGYTYLGTGSPMSPNENQDPLTDPLTRAGIVYFLSNNELPQMSALSECKGIGGELLSILNPVQDKDIQDLIFARNINGQIWTSGVYDTNIGQWYWASSNRIVNYSNFRNPVVDPNSSTGITVAGHLSAYGWNGFVSNQFYFRYICQFS